MATKRPELCRDPVWMRDAVSKFLESPVYSVPLLDFIDENCGMFEDSDDNKLEYTIVHENFKELVDGLISDFLSSLGIPVPTFVQMFAIEEHSSLYSIVVTSILIVDDFLLFKEMMLKRNFQISNQALSRMASQAHALQVPADLNSVIDHLSDVSKQRQLSDKEAAKSLSFAEAFQKQSKVLLPIYIFTQVVRTVI
uniref:Cilia- and flagella-associated protein 36 n=1 Tax=Physcomitrium patens TaxID=3218 RepID=A0A7I4FK20_PHYPA